ncbi:NodT family efflux transporter outer membrane factor (OMF) lipoprotein [Pseudomonas duriflava]|uniref:NodT family efflux transporter outer membrane factor (OMF) lipoprotein n=1 Tax=Pseudomonas duriflava TaxID=459528 RepID=A0A562Q7N2_9PSED|nr:efflux transporter outer membrane subunit [Pseudomonas duriflava]TWI52757.1 NodT family efflux transporter outer membrane factor (OMF) lipoprotein [Pseudomonas duriflava]
MTFFARRHYLGLTIALALGGCTVGPDYQRPQVSTPVAFKHAEGWQVAQPSDAAHRGAWWEVYGDATLSDLMQRLQASNQTLAQYEAQYRQARALVRSARSSFFPTITGGTSMSRSGQGGGSSTSRYVTQDGTEITTSSSSQTSNSFDASLGVSWVIDLWGEVRRSVESQTGSAQASVAELAATKLSLQSELAQNYFQLRVLDAQQRLLQATLQAYERSLRVTENQYRAGMTARADVAQATTQLKSTQADLIDLKYQRAQLENAIAVLVGVPPAEFSLAAVDSIPALPAIPVTVPSQLLQRRPDIAQAERQVMSANAEIGVAKAAYFPSLSLTASGGYSGDKWGGLVSTPNRFWSIGPAFDLTLFDFGARRAQLEQAEATYDQTVAQYRQTVLDGFREVEDYLVQLTVLDEESGVRQEALESARESLRLAENQYQAGLIDYLDVVTLQTTALTNERTNLTLLGSRLTASVQLITALGGGWDASDLQRDPVASLAD